MHILAALRSMRWEGGRSRTHGMCTGSAASCDFLGTVRAEAAGRKTLFSIVYSSDATSGFTSIDLAELLSECRVKNRAVGVTGMLLQENGHFLQALEGPEVAVRDLLARIERDPRHDHVQVLGEEVIEQRRFPDWTMGTGRIDDEAASSLVRYSDALAAVRVDQPGPPSRRRRLADWFKG